MLTRNCGICGNPVEKYEPEVGLENKALHICSECLQKLKELLLKDKK